MLHAVKQTSKCQNETAEILFVRDHTRIFRGGCIVGADSRRYASIAKLSWMTLHSDWINRQLGWTTDVKMSRRVSIVNHDIGVDCRRQAVIPDSRQLTSTTPE